jgi:hypothetical protein
VPHAAAGTCTSRLSEDPLRRPGRARNVPPQWRSTRREHTSGSVRRQALGSRTTGRREAEETPRRTRPAFVESDHHIQTCRKARERERDRLARPSLLPPSLGPCTTYLLLKPLQSFGLLIVGACGEAPAPLPSHQLSLALERSTCLCWLVVVAVAISRGAHTHTHTHACLLLDLALERSICGSKPSFFDNHHHHRHRLRTLRSGALPRP